MKSITRIPFVWGLTLGPLVATYMVLWTYTLLAQGQTGIVPVISSDPVSEYLTKGGAFAIIAILLSFYRRDWGRALDTSKEQMTILTRLVESATKAQTESAVALNASTTAVAASTVAISANTAALQRLLDRLDASKARAV